MSLYARIPIIVTGIIVLAVALAPIGSVSMVSVVLDALMAGVGVALIGYGLFAGDGEDL